MGVEIDTERRVAMIRGLEALLFVSDEPVTTAAISQTLGIDRREVDRLCQGLARSYEERDAGIVLRTVAGGWRLTTHPEAAGFVESFVRSSRHARLTKASLETLSIVAYKQPVTRHQVTAIRGVNSDGVLRALVDRGLVAEVGREDSPGRPVLYGTTPHFLERLGLDSLAELPPLAPLLSAASDDREARARADDAISGRAGDDQAHAGGELPEPSEE